MNNTKLSCLLIVQGEGRGHMTQAIAISEILKKADMHVSAVLLGRNKRRKIPDFFYKRITSPVHSFQSPNFVTDNDGRSIKIISTIVYNFKQVSNYVKSLRFIHIIVRKHNPDFIINFYDPLAGLYNFLYRPKVPMLCIAHQYIYHHPDFKFPEGHLPDRISLKIYTSLTSLGAAKKLALSFYPLEDVLRKHVSLIPPLLRKEIKEKEVTWGNYFLVYLLNKGYAEDIIEWQKSNSDIVLHCFTDREQVEDMEEFQRNFFFHKLNDKKFLDYMAGSKGVITTARFESTCEAMYLGKPVFMVPVEGHFEQFCNSRDAHKAGAGIYDSEYKISRFLEYIDQYDNHSESFRKWVETSPELILKSIRAVLPTQRSPRISSALNPTAN